MAPFADMAKFMAEKHQIADKSITPHRASLFMQMMDSAKLSEYVKSHRLYCGSVSTGEVLYTPIGFCCVERIGRDLDATGLCIRGVMPHSDLTVPVISAMAARVEMQGGKENVVYKALVDLCQKVCPPAESQLTPPGQVQQEAEEAE